MSNSDFIQTQFKSRKKKLSMIYGVHFKNIDGIASGQDLKMCPHITAVEQWRSKSTDGRSMAVDYVWTDFKKLRGLTRKRPMP